MPDLVNPVVLIHGWADNPEVLRLWREAEDALKSDGVDVFVPILPPVSSINERSEALVEQLERKYASKRLHLIAHSMGGLNARDVAYSNGNYSFAVLTVSTLGTPHRGITALDVLYNPLTLPIVTAYHDLLVTLVGRYVGDMDALKDMTAKNMIGKFNEERPNRHDVHYQSWTGQITPLIPNIFSPIQPTLYLLDGPNDGVVSVKSATWGTHMGNLVGVNHATLMRANIVLDTVSYLVGIENADQVAGQSDGSKPTHAS